MSVKQSRAIFKLSNSDQDVYVLRVHIAHSVLKCVQSNGQGPVCGMIKRSSNRNDSQNFLTPVAAVTTAPMGVTTPCYFFFFFTLGLPGHFSRTTNRKLNLSGLTL